MPFGAVELGELHLAPVGAGIGEACVNATQRGDRRGECTIDRILIANVADLGVDAHAMRGERRHGLGVLRRIRAPDRDIRAGLGQRLRHAEPDARIAAGDERDLARQVEGAERHQ